MNFGLMSRARRGAFMILGLLLAFTTLAAPAADLKFEAMLVWATNADASPNPDHKPVPPDVRKLLKGLPLKWKNFFLVKRINFSMPHRSSKKVALSDKCDIEIRHVVDNEIEVSLIGKGEPVLKRTQTLAEGKTLVLGGNAPDETGWLVVLKRTD
jgi:hypothetical protein